MSELPQPALIPIQPKGLRPKRKALEVGIGVVLGFVLSSLTGPGVISVLYKPPSGDAFSCAGTVKAALEKFVALQLGVAAAGGLGLGLFLFLARRFFENRSLEKAEAASAERAP